MSHDYIHGYTPSEMRRLSRMQEILNEATLAAIDLRGVHRVLDVGSGLGQLSRAFARALPGEGRVLGVERDARQLAAALRLAEDAGEGGLVDFRSGDATALPLDRAERGSFDLAHARFLLEHVRDPLAVVREMLGALRPGGRLVLVDDDHELLRLWPPCPAVEHVWRIYWESYRDHGTDPLVGRRLTELLHEAGAEPLRVAGIFYGACHGMPRFGLVVENLVGVLASAARALELSGRSSAVEMDRAVEALRAWAAGPTATLWYTLPMAEGRRPEAAAGG